MSLVITSEPGSSCASWMPAPVEPAVLPLDTSPWRYYWNGGAITDGRGDLLLSIGTDCCQDFATPAGDGGIQLATPAWQAVPQRGGFMVQDAEQGPCLICDTWLSAWPDGGTVPTGNGLSSSQNCAWAARAEGDGAYVSCTGPTLQNAPPTFSRYDGALAQLWSIAGDGNAVVAADRNDRLLEANASGQWRWVDESLTPLSGWFDGAKGAAAALMGGGFLDSSLRFIPSGSAAVSAAPGWLSARPRVSTVLGGRAYALGGNDCTLEIRHPSGTLCGTLTIENCRAPPAPGADGTITILEDPELGAKSTATYVSWPGLLR